ncbi:efflux RND transporter permease subunit [Altericroceibacterium spongiae]|uniref:Efflux RND transporter permease subunit n=1 Tax=Altericroceibacterium spongiae TaxID=2320269 RepID=A0A420EEI8_9SPHN|nr:efflux RND transporter permease subunit [Altericroceibacterium spongiae]RKF19107.1 efflux RND transporter permease subunit [Altericroceibacterium spongiae]
MSFRNISAWSIRNPIVPLLLFAGLLLAGMVSFSRMEVQDNPDIEFPLVIVQISLPGAAPTEIENQITQRVEAAVNTINGVDQITSTAEEGSSQTEIQFDLGTNINEAVNDVKNQIDQIRGELPEGILEPYVFKVETANNTLVYFGIAADDMTMEQLSWFVDDTVTKRLLSIPGLAEVNRSGGVDREILVILDPAKMQSLGVTATEVNQTLRALNVNAAGGRAEIAGSRQSVRVLGNAEDAYDLSQTQISLGNGRTIKLSDIASVQDKYGEVTSVSRINGKQVVTFGVSRARGASDVTVYDEAVEVLKKIEAENPGVRFTRLYTTVDYTKQQYESSIAAMIEGAVLAVVVVFFFLRDWRATIIAALAIPLSAIPTFWFMDLLGFTLNQMSLLALGLVAGVLVDDAIVEIENIVRHMRMGKTAYQAAIDAADEIGLAVVATTFSIVAVFFPVALMPGVAGQFFKNFGLTVVVSVLMSLAVARMITPMVAAYFLKAHGHAEHGGGWLMDRYLSVLRWSLSEGRVKNYRSRRQRADGSVRLRTRFASRFLDHRLWMMGIGLAAFMLTIFCAGVLPKQFFPDADSDFSRLTIEMVPGTTIEQTGEVTHKVAAMLRDQPEVEFALERVREGNATISLTLSPDRPRSSVEFERAMTPVLQKIPDARINFEGNNPGSGGRPIQVMLSGSDPEKLNQAAAQLVEQMKGVDGAVSPRIDADLQRPEIIIKPREDLASSLGVSTSAISQTVRIATLGDIDQNAAKFSLSDRQIPIRVRLSEKARRDISVIRNLPVQTATGGSVPLSRVADISFGSGPTTIDRFNQQRRIFVSADLAPGISKGTVMERINNLPIMRELPTGISNAPFGEDKFQAELIANFEIALVTGIFLVFGVLVLLYHRLVSPLVNMSSLFLAPLGGFLALLALGQPISLPVFIGVLMLFGIVAKNSILLIDFAIEEMAAGASRFDAIVEAGHKRAQPILMTTVAMTAGMVPTALSLSGDAAWRAPMGVVVIGGLLLSTLLTLLIVPAGFSLADGLEKRIGPWLRTRVLTYDPSHADNGSSHAHPAE